VPRALWTGSISFGLVSAPVRMYAAVDEHNLDFHLVHVKDGSRIGYRKWCKLEDAPVPDDEVAKAYEVDGELVVLEPEDFEAADAEAYKTVEILAFAPADEVDPIYFERSYYLGPQSGGEKVYDLLVEAMRKAGLLALVRYVFHDREHLGALRVRDDVLMLVSMHFADEIRPADDIRPGKRSKIDERELEMALQLIEQFGGEVDLTQVRDSYRDRLLELIEQKRAGGDTRAPARREEEPSAPDLLEALRESIERHARGAGATNGHPRLDGLEEMTTRELGERARALDIEGRSRMTKKELVAAIREADD
jgi:DNA end-binding protein Ku